MIRPYLLGLASAHIRDLDLAGRVGIAQVPGRYDRAVETNPGVGALAVEPVVREARRDRVPQRILKKHGLRSDERIELLLSWRHTGFSLDNSVTVYPSDEQGLERLARYMIRSPVSLQRLNYIPETQQVLYQSNKGHDQQDSEIIDSMEFLARALMHVPDLNKSYIRYYGIYSNRSNLKPRKDSTPAEATQNEDPPRVSNSNLRRRWANLIRRVYQADPLTCPKCGSRMRILSFITTPDLPIILLSSFSTNGVIVFRYKIPAGRRMVSENRRVSSSQHNRMSYYLNDAFMMIPTKSVSGIRFASERSFTSCQLCPRQDCRGRRSPYDPELYERDYSSRS